VNTDIPYTIIRASFDENGLFLSRFHMNSTHGMQVKYFITIISHE
jgi:hypothetical protein